MSLRRALNFTGYIVLALVISAFLPIAFAQDQQPSKVDIFAGYSFLNPRGNVAGTRLEDINSGFTVSSTYFVNKYAGFTFDVGGHFDSNNDISTFQIGPTFRYPLEDQRFTPFGHFLIGLHRLDFPGFDTDNGIGITTGGGFDLNIHPRFSWRVVQADYQYAHHNFNPLGGRSNHNGARVSTGIVMHFGNFGPPPPPPSVACSAQPAEIFEGEPVTATAIASNFNPKRTLTYTWNATGGARISGAGSTANVDTKGLQPGSYSVRANVTDGKKGSADCSASFIVKQPRPPVISCAANPSTVAFGGTSEINCNASSPDNRPLTYSHSATIGTLTENGSNAVLNTSGAEPGLITVTGMATDDRNLSASSRTTVTVEAPPPPPPPPPQASELNSIAFKKNNSRVDNAAKAILDDVALRMQREADAKLIIIGASADGERNGEMLAAQRAANAKTYLVDEKGIDPTRIALRTGGEPGMTAVFWLVPAGAEAPAVGAPVDENALAKRPAKKR